MKKISIILLSMVMMVLLTTGNVNAKEVGSNGIINYSDDYTAEEAINDFDNKKLKTNDSSITKNDIEVGLQQQNELNESSNVKRAAGYSWVLTKQTTYQSYGALKGHYSKKVTAGTSLGSSTISFQISGSYKAITLSATYTFSIGVTYNGPSGTEKVGSKYATHRLYSSIGYGKIMKNTFVYKDRYSGATAGTKTTYIITNKNTKKYSNLAYINASNSQVTVRSAGSAKTKTFKNETAFKNKVNSTSPVSAVDF